MQYHPLPFTENNVMAVYEDRKDQTRRIVRESMIKVFLHNYVRSELPFKNIFASPGVHKAYLNPHGAVSVKAKDGNMLGVKPGEFEWVSPYGRIGDRLWVKEAIRVYRFPEENTVTVEYRADSEYRKISLTEEAMNKVRGWKRSSKPPMFMPRWAARLFLEITDIRVQRLEEISEEDSRREGAVLEKCTHPDCQDGSSKCCCDSYRGAFAVGWTKINADRGFPWGTNPWV